VGREEAVLVVESVLSGARHLEGVMGAGRRELREAGGREMKAADAVWRERWRVPARQVDGQRGSST